MRKLASILAIICMVSLAYAEDLNWHTNYNEALDKAVIGNKFVLADFTGSDWCPWCIKLDKEVFSTPEFATYAKDNLILFKADFPRTKDISAEIKDQNIRLMDKYGVMGFPTILILDKHGETVTTMGYEQGGPLPYIASIKKAIAEYKPDTDTRNKAQKSLEELRELTGDSQLAADKSDAPDSIGFFDNMFKDKQN